MNRKTIITALLALVALTTFGQGNNIADTYWRNEQTGDWQIGFAEKHVIYNNKVWEIVSQTEKKDAYTLAVDNGDVIKVGKLKNGRRAIAIGKGKPVLCSQITTKGLPAYPTKDTCTAFRDTHYQTDTVTLVGWLKDMPKELRDKSDECDVACFNIFTGNQVSNYGKMDSLGRFEVKVPLLNSSQVFFDWDRTVIHTLFEPGETYFLLCDFKTGQKFFMGKNCRLQNEILAFPIKWPYIIYGTDMDEAAATQFFESMKKARNDNMAKLEKIVKAHPTISERYIAFQTDYYNASEGRQLVTARYDMTGWITPATYLDYLNRQHWQRRIHPYTLFRESCLFSFHYVDQLVIDRYATKSPFFTFFTYYDQEVLCLKRYRDIGKVFITDEELMAIKRFGEGEQQEKVVENADVEFEQQDYAERYKAITSREDIKKVLTAERPLFPVYQTLAILDSIGCDRALRDIIITNKLYQIFDYSREPLSETAMQFFEANVSMPAAKSFLQAEQEKYLAIQRRAASQNTSLKSSDDLAGMSDGEQILRKIIEPYHGRLILLDIWGTWCGPCKDALSHSKEEFERLKDYNLVYLYLANRSEDEAWKNVIKEYDLTGEDIVHYNLPAVQQSAIEHFLNVYAFPSYRLIDRDGTMLDMNADPRNLEGLARLLEKLK